MKNLFLLLTVITLRFQTCSRSVDNDYDQIIAECSSPINLSVSETTADSAILNWENLNDNLDVTIEYGIIGFTPGNGTVISASQNSMSIDGLNPFSTYDFYIKAFCSGDRTSMLSEVRTFSTDMSPYAGIWRGIYEGDDSGIWIFVYSPTGEFISGSYQSNNAPGSDAAISGTLTADGAITSVSANGTISVGQLIGGTAVGTWSNGNLSGTSIGSSG